MKETLHPETQIVCLEAGSDFSGIRFNVSLKGFTANH